MGRRGGPGLRVGSGGGSGGAAAVAAATCAPPAEACWSSPVLSSTPHCLESWMARRMNAACCSSVMGMMVDGPEGAETELNKLAGMGRGGREQGIVSPGGEEPTQAWDGSFRCACCGRCMPGHAGAKPIRFWLRRPPN